MQQIVLMVASGLYHTPVTVIVLVVLKYALMVFGVVYAMISLIILMQKSFVDNLDTMQLVMHFTLSNLVHNYVK